MSINFFSDGVASSQEIMVLMQIFGSRGKCWTFWIHEWGKMDRPLQYQNQYIMNISNAFSQLSDYQLNRELSLSGT